MVHEFTRNDRKSPPTRYIYADIFIQIHTSLCEDRGVAEKHGFVGSHFAKNAHGRLHDDSLRFDFDSIMLYPSDVVARHGCPRDKWKCPLLKYPPPEYRFGDVGIPELIEDPEGPSAGDVVWLKHCYPAE
ncbi:hypothetical protein E8E12_005366 [Didymella heteroderae]|uniref:Uncharacterized protein n=1 Tax=Didymella heteroderae TaxID=1769908 RepID=A0A9P4WJI7_9PLEO|nr:hypothetical protein E8E12_005366 [Didymella heteroderae]